MGARRASNHRSCTCGRSPSRSSSTCAGRPLLVLLLALGRGRHKIAVVAASGGAIASAAVMALMFDPGGDPLRVYYGTDTRAQAFLVGSVAALAAPHLSVRAQRAVAWLGLGALAALMYAMTTDAPGVLYRGGFGVAAVAAALAVRRDDRARAGLVAARPRARCAGSAVSPTASTYGIGRPACS